MLTKVVTTFFLQLLSLRETLSSPSPSSLLGAGTGTGAVIVGKRQERRTRTFNYLEGPRFVREPPAGFLHFSNETGTSIHCVSNSGSSGGSGSGIEGSNLQTYWILSPPGVTGVSGLSSESLVTRIPHLREPLNNGTLFFPPFPASAYRQEIHTATYRCLAKNNAGTIISRAVHLRAVVNQPFDVAVYDEFVIRGNTAVLKCQIPSFVSSYVTVTSWLKNSGLEITGHGEKYSVFPSGELHVRNVGVSDAYTRYRCQARHRLTNETKTSDSQGAIVLSEPSNSVPPRVTDSKPVVTAEEGTNFVELPCAAEGWPVPQFKWFKMDVPESSAPRFLTSSGPTSERLEPRSGSLILRNLGSQDAGKYVCVVVNSVGEATAETEVRITKRLQVKVEPQRLVVDANQRAVFNCSVVGYPWEKVLWVYNGLPIGFNDDSKRMQFLGSQSILVINGVSSREVGMYQCLAENEGDSSQASAQLTLGDVAPYLVETFAEQMVNIDDKLSLRCVATGSPLPMITWTLDGLPLEARKGAGDLLTLRRALWGDYVVYDEGHVVSHVNVTVGSVYDGGRFECRASNSIGAVGHQAMVRVKGRTQIREMANKSAVASGSILLPCWTVGLEPGAVVWEKDGKKVPYNHRQRVHKNGSLEISNLDKVIDSGTYTCAALPSESRDGDRNRDIGIDRNKDRDPGNAVRQSMQLKVKVPPVIEDFKFDNKLQAGMRTRIYCNAAQGDHPVKLKWYKDGKAIQGKVLSGLSVREIDQFSLALAIENLASHHNGNYTCFASNEAASVNHSAELLVNVPPKWLIEPKNTMVVEGNSLTVDCMARGYPVPQVTWKRLVKTGLEIPTSASQQYQLIRSGPHYQVYENGTLRLSKTVLTDRGGYLCQASNGIGPGLSTVIQLKVNTPARFEGSLKEENMTVHKGQPVQLRCLAVGDQPLSIHWKRGSQSLPIATEPRYSYHEEHTEKGLMSLLNISAVARIDSIAFTCNAVNDFGSDVKLIGITVQEVPEPPFDLQLESKSSRSLALRWREPYNGNSLIHDYIIRVTREQPGSLLDSEQGNITVSGNLSSAVLRNLRPSHQYTIDLWARNGVGVSASGKPLRVVTDEEAPGGPPVNVRLTAVDAHNVNVDWLPPRLDLTNGQIKGYYIGYKVLNSSDHFVYKTVQPQQADGVGASFTLVLQGLLPFTDYLVILQAFNSVGAGPRSDELVIRTGEGTPSVAPNNIKCTPLSPQSLKVSWDRLASDRINGFLKGYKVQYQVTPRSDLASKTELTRDQSRLILYGLHKFSNYSVRVTAFTGAGNGPFSEAIFCRTHEDVPSSPKTVKAAVAGSDAIVVSWEPPFSPNGILKSYTVTRKSSHDGSPVTFTVPRHLRYYKATGLAKGAKYTFSVTATNGAGEGPSSALITQTLSDKGPARIVTFGDTVEKYIGDTLELACRAVGLPTPATDWRFNGQPVSARTGSGRNVEQLMNGSLRVVDLTLEETGNFSCHASNLHGSDFISYNVLVKANKDMETVPLPPLIKVTNSTNKSITVEWRARTSDNYPPVAQEIYFKSMQTNSEWKHYVINEERPENATFVINNLVCGSQYQVYMVTVNGIGKSGPSDILHTKTAGREPLASPATVFISRVNRTSVKLNLNTWRHGGCPIVDYSIQWRSIHAAHWNTLYAVSVSEPAVLNGLNNELSYKVRVTMKNSAGSTAVEYEARTSPFKSGNIITHRSPSDAPEHISVSNFNNAVHEEGDAPLGPLFVTTVVTLLLLLAAILSIVVLYKTLQRKFTSNVSGSNRLATSHQSISKVPFVRNNTCPDNVSSGGSGAGASELAILASTIDRCKSKQNNVLSGLQGNNMSEGNMTTILHSPDESGYQYLTISRRPSFPKKPNPPQGDELYSVIQKHENNKTATKQPLAVGLSTDTSPRYSTPKAASFLLSSPSMEAKLVDDQQLHSPQQGPDVNCCNALLETTARKSLDCPCCSLFEPECCSARQWQPSCDFHAVNSNATATLLFNTLLK